MARSADGNRRARRLTGTGARAGAVGAAVVILVAASVPGTATATHETAVPLWTLGGTAVVGVLLAVLGALTLLPAFSARRSDAEAAGLAVIAAAVTLLGTGLAFLAAVRTGSVYAEALLATPGGTTSAVNPAGGLFGPPVFPVPGRLLVVGTGLVMILAASLAARARGPRWPGTAGADRPPDAGASPRPFAASVAVVGALLVAVGASVLPWRSGLFTGATTVWQVGGASAAGAGCLLASAVVLAVAAFRPPPDVVAAVTALVATAAATVGGGLLFADWLPGIRVVGGGVAVLIYRPVDDPAPTVELLVAGLAVLGGATLVVGVGVTRLAGLLAPSAAVGLDRVLPPPVAEWRATR